METQWHSNFPIARILDDKLVVSNCTLDFVIDVAKDGPKNIHKKSLMAMKFWIDHFLNGSIAYNIRASLETKLFEQLSNNIIMCPEDPHDYLILVLIHSKLNAIGGGFATVTKTKFRSDTAEGFSSTFDGDVSDWLPTLKDWMGDIYYFDKPWWHRGDGSTIDMPVKDGDDIENKPDILIDLIDVVSFDDPIDDTQQAEIIKPIFKPVIINNDNT